MKKLSVMLLSLFVATLAVDAQKLSKMEELLQSKQKWTVMDVKSKRPYFEIGETFTIRIDRKFYHDRNNYAKLGGDWTLDGKNGFRLTYRNKYNKKEKVYLK